MLSHLIKWLRDAEDGLAESQDILSRESRDLEELNDLINRFSEIISLIPTLTRDFDDMRQVLCNVNNLEQHVSDLSPLLKDSFEGNKYTFIRYVEGSTFTPSNNCPP